MAPMFDQELVDQPVAPQHGQPGDGADEITGPERHHGQQEQRELPFEILDLHRQEIGQRIGEDQADRHHRDGEAKRGPQRADEDRRCQEIAVVWIEETLDDEERAVVLEREGWRHAVTGRFPEAENEDREQRQKQKDDEPRGRRRNQDGHWKAGFAAVFALDIVFGKHNRRAADQAARRGLSNPGVGLDRRHGSHHVQT